MRFVRGVRVSDGFLNQPGCLPVAIAENGDYVVVRRPNEADVRCLPTGAAGEWAIPCDLPDGTYDVAAVSSSSSAEDAIAQARLKLVGHTLSAEFKGASSGAFRIESCCPEELAFQGPGRVPPVITGPDRALSADLLHLDSTVRYLGPGLGEMSLDRGCGFDWVAIGPKGRPEALLFIGNPEKPLMPSNRRSPDAGDRTHWRAAFARARNVVWKGASGEYEAIEGAPSAVRDALRRYTAHFRLVEGEPCEPTNLGDHSWARMEAPATGIGDQVLDVLGALSCRRSGLSYPTARDYFFGIANQSDPILFEQVLRSWTECGIVDQLRGSLIGRKTVVMRRPYFAMVRRGSLVDATLMGWLPTSSAAELRRRAASLKLNLSSVTPQSVFQPSLVRLAGVKPSAVVELSVDLGLDKPEWLIWPDEEQVPSIFNVAETLRSLTTG